MGGLAFCFGKERAMKLNLIFLLLDSFILLTYPLVYVANQVRRLLKSKR